MDAEILSVTDGVDEAIGQPFVCAALRQGSDRSAVNYSLTADNGRSLFGRV
jgi:hypothetical protein